MIAEISNEGENSTVVIWKAAVTWTEAWPCCDGVNCTGAPSNPDTICSPAMLKDGLVSVAGFCCCDGFNRICPRLFGAGWTFAISKLTCRFMAGWGCWEGARRMVTTFETGRNCSAPILNVGVSCMDAISHESVICTAVCMPVAGPAWEPGAAACTD